MGRPGNSVCFLLIDFALAIHLKERFPHEGRVDDGYDLTDAHILAIAELRKPISTCRTVLKRESGFACFESSSVSSSLVPQGSVAGELGLTWSYWSRVGGVGELSSALVGRVGSSQLGSYH